MLSKGAFWRYLVTGKGWLHLLKKELQHAARHPAALCRESLLLR